MKFNVEQKELISLLQFRDELKEKKLTDSQKLIYAHLCLCNDGYTDMKEQTNGWFTQSYQQIKDATGINSDHTIVNTINFLLNAGLIFYKKGSVNGRIANSFFILHGSKVHKKCSDDLKKSAVIDFEKCSDEERLNYLKHKKFNKKCSDEENKKCSIDIEIDIEKEQYIEQLIKENKLLKEELDKVKKENNLKNDNMMKHKEIKNCPSNEGNKTAEPVSDNLKCFSSKEDKNNVPSTKSEVTPEGEKENKMIPSNEGWKSRKAEQDELKKEFDFFICNLKNLTVEEREKNLASFKMKAESVFTGKYVDIYKDNFQKRYNGYTAKMNINNPSTVQTQEKAQPCNKKSTEGAPSAKINLFTCEYAVFERVLLSFAKQITADKVEKITEKVYQTIEKNIALTSYDKEVLKYVWQQQIEKFTQAA